MLKAAASRVSKILMTGALSAGLLAAVPATANAAIDGWTWNWSNWWEAHAYIEVYNPSICRQSVARIGNYWVWGWPSNWRSQADASGYSWTHEAYQRAC